MRSSEKSDMAYENANTTPSILGAPRPFFVQYLNPEILSLYGIKYPLGRKAVWEMLRLTRYGALIGRERIVFPDSYNWEVAEFKTILNNIAPACRAGIVYISKSAIKSSLYAEKKREEYRDEPEIYDSYARPVERTQDDNLRIAPRIARSTASDIASGWADLLNTGCLLDRILHNQSFRFKRLSAIEDAVASVPERLDGRAFISRYAIPLLPFTPYAQDITRISYFISRVYLESYLSEHRAFILSDTNLGGLDCELDTYSKRGEIQKISYRYFAHIFETLGISRCFERLISWNQLLRLRTSPIVDWFIQYALNRPDELESAAHAHAILSNTANRVHSLPTNGSDALCEIESKLNAVREIIFAGSYIDVFRPSPVIGFGCSHVESLKERAMSTNNSVFLVHGRDAQVVSSIKTLLRAANLNPLDWEEIVGWTGHSSPNTLEVIKIGLEKAQAILVLLTPDETASLRESLIGSNESSELGYQPRPNVLIEIGMAVALNPTRTLLLKLGPIRSISDIAGLNFLAFSGDAASRHALVERLKIAGCAARPTSEFFNLELSLPAIAK